TAHGEIEILVERRIPGICRGGEQKRVAVRRRFCDHFCRERAAGAGSIFDDELLAEVLRQPLTDQARIGVVDAAGRKARYDPYRPCRVVLGGVSVASATRPAASCRTFRRLCLMCFFRAQNSGEGYTLACILRSVLSP